MIQIADNQDMTKDMTKTTKGQPAQTDVERREGTKDEPKSFRLLDNRISFKLVR